MRKDFLDKKSINYSYAKGVGKMLKSDLDSYTGHLRRTFKDVANEFRSKKGKIKVLIIGNNEFELSIWVNDKFLHAKMKKLFLHSDILPNSHYM